VSAVFRIGVTPDFYTDAKGDWQEALREQLGNAPGVEYEPMPPQPGKVATPEALDQFDAILWFALKVTRESLRGVKRLSVAARFGVGYDMIDVDALTESDIALAITPEAVRRPVAEAILALVFALSKNLMEQDRSVRAGRWRGGLSRLGRNLSACSLGSVGCGNIAREMFRLARPLGFSRLLASDPYVRQEDVSSLGVQLADMDTLFRESDFVAVNALLNRDTEGLVGERQLRQMKPTAFLINTSRGPVVQPAALVRALDEKWIAGAGIDVFAVEPPAKDDPLLAMDNVILAPHALAWTDELMRDTAVEACRNTLAVARGESPPGIVNQEVLQRPGFQRKLEGYRLTHGQAR
jgi:phosphoglycerate dehydrogenase-like enzyme